MPPGIDAGTRIRYTGKGEAGERGAPAGDLYVLIDVEEHEHFKRDGQETWVQVPVPYTTMALGGTIQVPTVHGTEDLKIPAGTPSGKIFDLPGKGLEDPHRHRGRGTHHVMTVVDVPKKLDKDEKELLRKLAKAQGTKVDEPSWWEKMFG